MLGRFFAVIYDSYALYPTSNRPVGDSGNAETRVPVGKISCAFGNAKFS